VSRAHILIYCTISEVNISTHTLEFSATAPQPCSAIQMSSRTMRITKQNSVHIYIPTGMNPTPPPANLSSSFRQNAAARAPPPPAIAQRLAAAQLGAKTAPSSSPACSSTLPAVPAHVRTHFLSSNAHELVSDSTGRAIYFPWRLPSFALLLLRCVIAFMFCGLWISSRFLQVIPRTPCL
jgi:hypothetical protein